MLTTIICSFLVCFFLATLLFYKKNVEKVFLGSVAKLNTNEEVTTLLPIPLKAATCDHNWDKIEDTILEMPHEKKAIIIYACIHCGLIDKTIQVTSPAPPETPHICHHDWGVITEQILDMPHEKKRVTLLSCKKCGVLDKTQTTSSEMPKIAPPRSECRHRWDTEKRVILESAYEQMLKSVGKEGKLRQDINKSINLDLNDAPIWMFRKCFIVSRICQTCGEVDKTIAYNIEEEEAVTEE